MIMKIAVITPYFNEDLDTLARCHKSVLSQTYAQVDHVMVSDGNPNSELDKWNLKHIRIPNTNDYGDTPRCLGALYAYSAGYDGICFLDADNWFETNHVTLMTWLQGCDTADVVTATRTLRREDGSVLGVCKESDGQSFNDTNCYLIMRQAIPVVQSVLFKHKDNAIIGDRVLWRAILDAKFKLARCTTPTVNYTTLFAVHYAERGEEPPANAKVIAKFPSDSALRMYSYSEYKAAIDALRQ